MFTNLLMKHGRKAEAQSKVSRILSMLHQASNQPPIPLLQRAISLSCPSIRLRNVRRSIKTIQTPSPLDERQRARQGIVWIFRAAEKGRKGTPREQRIAREILAVLEGESDVYKWLEDRHKQAALVRSNINFKG
ncbi:MAG: hypothetical protein TREMPRED_006058 [Tremellales sp. Tagirdzhanova-0007]|nr:MAG: hypothetical protein TREMPRED_006058 [Tremellales sp. Tagirdzhanova-0007]